MPNVSKDYTVHYINTSTKNRQGRVDHVTKHNVVGAHDTKFTMKVGSQRNQTNYTLFFVLLFAFLLKSSLLESRKGPQAASLCPSACICVCKERVSALQRSVVCLFEL